MMKKLIIVTGTLLFSLSILAEKPGLQEPQESQKPTLAGAFGIYGGGVETRTQDKVGSDSTTHTGSLFIGVKGEITRSTPKDYVVLKARGRGGLVPHEPSGRAQKGFEEKVRTIALKKSGGRCGVGYGMIADGGLSVGQLNSAHLNAGPTAGFICEGDLGGGITGIIHLLPYATAGGVAEVGNEAKPLDSESRWVFKTGTSAQLTLSGDKGRWSVIGEMVGENEYPSQVSDGATSVRGRISAAITGRPQKIFNAGKPKMGGFLFGLESGVRRENGKDGQIPESRRNTYFGLHVGGALQ